MKDEKFNRTDKITGFTDTTIVFDSYSILLKKIRFIRLERTNGFLGYANGPRLIMAGLLLAFVDFANYTLIRGQAYHPNKGILIVSGSLVTAGLILTSTRYHKFRPGRLRTFLVRDY